MKFLTLTIFSFFITVSIFAGSKSDINVNVTFTINNNNTDKKTKEKPKGTLRSELKKLVQARGIQRAQIIDNLDRFGYKNVVSSLINLMRSKDVTEQIAGAEASGVIKSKRYKKYIHKLFKSDLDDDELIEALIFSVGSNKFKSLGKYICPHIANKRLYKASFLALKKLKKNPCIKEMKKILKGKDLKKRAIVLEAIAISADKKFQKEVVKIFNTEKGSLKFMSGVALVAMDHPKGGDYMIKYLYNDVKYESIRYRNFKNLNKMVPKGNKNIIKILKKGTKSPNTKLRLFSIVEIVLRGHMGDLDPKDIDFVNLYKDTTDPSLATIAVKYKLYMKKMRKKNKK